MDWPRTVFEAPVLRPLDERAKSDVIRAGRITKFADGAAVYRAGDPGDSFFVVVQGQVRVMAVRRGDERESELRVARRGDTFGEEAALPGAQRWANAFARGEVELAEIPMGVLTRALSRSGGGDVVDREERALRRAASRDLLRTLAFARDLSDDDLELLLDGVRWQTLPRRARLYGKGDPGDSAFLVVGGLMQLQTEADERVEVRAYVGRGDFFGDEEALAGERRPVHAVALGECQLLRVPRDLLRTLVDRNPELVSRMRRVSAERQVRQLAVVGDAAARTTQHVFHDLYRMQMARSLLAIDQEACVRCGHCAWACAETHDGVARLVRRGDKILTELESVAVRPKSLMLPSSCQHCHNPACMIDCPTGAIGRDTEGEVFIREDLCTGCGACAKACPWDNIRMAPRAGVAQEKPDSARGAAGASAEVAVKCDLCHDYAAPACVSSCPTEAILRLDPQRDFAEVRRLLGGTEASGERAGVSPQDRVLRSAIPIALGLGLAALVAGASLHASGAWTPGRGLAYVSGVSSAVGVLALALYALPKRLVRRFMKRREKKSATRRSVTEDKTALPRSRLHLHYVAHVAIGLVVIGGVALHAGFRVSTGTAGALGAAFWLACGLGALGAALYRLVPRRLARLERKGALPEDLVAERDALFDRLHRATSGKSDLMKTIAERLLVPYARAPFGPVALLISGRSLGEEERALQERVQRVLEGRGKERLDGLRDVIRIVVELRALPLRRGLTRLLGGFLPLHVVLGAIVIVLLLIHIVQMTRW